jgi:hypothetical protein
MDLKSLKYFFTHKQLNMRQQRLLELVKDCDLTINYTLGKAYVVADAFSIEDTCNMLIGLKLSKELQKRSSTRSERTLGRK